MMGGLGGGLGGLEGIFFILSILIFNLLIDRS